MTGCGRLALWCGPCVEAKYDDEWEALGKVAESARGMADVLREIRGAEMVPGRTEERIREVLAEYERVSTSAKDTE